MADPVTDDWFADVQAVLENDAAADDPIEDTAPDMDSTPSTEEPVVAAEPTADPGPAPVVEPPAAAAPSPALVNWDDPANPYREPAQRMQQVSHLAERLQMQQAEKLRQQKLAELADGDPSQAQKITAFLQDAQQPLVQRATELETTLEHAAKLATVAERAITLIAPELTDRYHAEVERLMSLPGGPSVLENDIATRSTIRTEYEAKLAATNAELAELRKQLAARSELQERAQSGADTVGAGAGNGGSFAARWDAASNFEEAFDAIANEIGLRPTG